MFWPREAMKVNTCPSPPRPICPARPGSDPPLHENVRILENGAVFRASEIVAIVGRHVGVATGADQLSGSLGRLISRIDTGAGAASVPAATFHLTNRARFARRYCSS